MHRLLCVAVAITAVATCVSARQSSSATAEKGKTGAVSGRVTTAGEPTAGVRIVATKRDVFRGEPVAEATTDAEGKYTLSAIPLGTYLVQAEAPGYVLDNGIDSWEGSGRPISVTSEETVEHIDLTLTPGGVITGRVTNSSGQPLVLEYVSILEADADPQNRQQIQLWPPPSTDDRGIYRAFGLPPGKYLVAVGKPPQMAGGNGSSYDQTFYPGVRDPGRAESVDVATGTVASGVDIAVGDPTTAYSVSGRGFFEGTSEPVPKAFVEAGTLIEGKLARVGGGGTAVEPDGRYQLAGLSPGSYRLTMFRFGDESSAGYADPVDVEITDHDVTGVDIVFKAGVRVSGVVELDGPDAATARRDLAKQTLRASRLSGPEEGDGLQMPGPQHGGKIGTDLGFTVAGLKPGRYRFYIAGDRTTGGVSPYHVVSVDVGGAPVTDGLEVREGADVEDVHVHVRIGRAVVKGAVTVVGTPRPDLEVQVIIRKGPEDGGFVAYARADERGRFVVEDVVPGSFEILASGRAPTTSGGKPFEVKGDPVKIEVPESGEISVDLRLDLRESGGEEQ